MKYFKETLFSIMARKGIGGAHKKKPQNYLSSKALNSSKSSVSTHYKFYVGFNLSCFKSSRKAFINNKKNPQNGFHILNGVLLKCNKEHTAQVYSYKNCAPMPLFWGGKKILPLCNKEGGEPALKYRVPLFKDPKKREMIQPLRAKPVRALGGGSYISYNFNEHLNKNVSGNNEFFWNQCFDKGRLKNFVLWFVLNYGEQKTLELVEELKNLGFKYATKAGISLGIDDLKIPPKKADLIFEGEKVTLLTIKQYKRGEITGVERFQRLIDTWHRTSENLKQEVIDYFEKTDRLNPVYMMAFSGARGNISQVRQLVGMRGLMSNPQGQIIDYPIRSNFREGLTLTEYIISSYGARKGIVDTALRTANAGYLTRRLVDVAQHVIISNFDCKTNSGIFLTDMKEGNKIIYSLQNRLVGRILGDNIQISNGPVRPSADWTTHILKEGASLNQLGAGNEKKPGTLILKGGSNLKGLKIIKRNTEISLDLSFDISKTHKKVFVRSVLTCNNQKLVCQLCYGWSLAQGNLVSIGEAVGIIAAQSIGEPGTQLTMRTFHTGGVFAGGVTDQIKAPFDSVIEYGEPIPGKLVRTPEGKIAFLTINEGFFIIKDCFNNASNGPPGATPNLNSTPPLGEPYLKKRVGWPNKTKQKKYKIPIYTLLFKRMGEKVFLNEVIAQISSLSNQKNATDDEELTIKSELEGELYAPGVKKTMTEIGPKLRKDEKPKEDRLGGSAAQNPNPIPFDPLFQASEWCDSWVLSGKIYRLPLASSFFPMLGDFINRKTVMNQIKWKFHKEGLLSSTSLEFYSNIMGTAQQNKQINPQIQPSQFNDIANPLNSLGPHFIGFAGARGGNKRKTNLISSYFKTNPTLTGSALKGIGGGYNYGQAISPLLRNPSLGTPLRPLRAEPFRAGGVPIGVFKGGCQTLPTSGTPIVNVPSIKHSLLSFNVKNVVYKKHGYSIQVASGINPEFILNQSRGFAPSKGFALGNKTQTVVQHGTRNLLLNDHHTNPTLYFKAGSIFSRLKKNKGIGGGPYFMDSNSLGSRTLTNPLLPPPNKKGALKGSALTPFIKEGFYKGVTKVGLRCWYGVGKGIESGFNQSNRTNNKSLSKEDILLLISPLKRVESRKKGYDESLWSGPIKQYSTMGFAPFNNQKKGRDQKNLRSSSWGHPQASGGSRVYLSNKQLNPFLNLSKSPSNWVPNFPFFLNWYPSNFQMPMPGMVFQETFSLAPSYMGGGQLLKGANSLPPLDMAHPYFKVPVKDPNGGPHPPAVPVSDTPTLTGSALNGGGPGIHRRVKIDSNFIFLPMKKPRFFLLNALTGSALNGATPNPFRVTLKGFLNKQKVNQLGTPLRPLKAEPFRAGGVNFLPGPTAGGEKKKFKYGVARSEAIGPSLWNSLTYKSESFKFINKSKLSRVSSLSGHLKKGGALKKAPLKEKPFYRDNSVGQPKPRGFMGKAHNSFNFYLKITPKGFIKILSLDKENKYKFQLDLISKSTILWASNKFQLASDLAMGFAHSKALGLKGVGNGICLGNPLGEETLLRGNNVNSNNSLYASFIKKEFIKKMQKQPNKKSLAIGHHPFQGPLFQSGGPGGDHLRGVTDFFSSENKINKEVGESVHIRAEPFRFLKRTPEKGLDVPPPFNPRGVKIGAPLRPLRAEPFRAGGVHLNPPGGLEVSEIEDRSPDLIKGAKPPLENVVAEKFVSIECSELNSSRASNYGLDPTGLEIKEDSIDLPIYLHGPLKKGPLKEIQTLQTNSVHFGVRWKNSYNYKQNLNLLTPPGGVPNFKGNQVLFNGLLTPFIKPIGGKELKLSTTPLKGAFPGKQTPPMPLPTPFNPRAKPIRRKIEPSPKILRGFQSKFYFWEETRSSTQNFIREEKKGFKPGGFNQSLKPWTKVVSKQRPSDLSINNSSFGRIFFTPQLFYEIPYGAPPHFSVLLKNTSEKSIIKGPPHKRGGQVLVQTQPRGVVKEKVNPFSGHYFNPLKGGGPGGSLETTVFKRVQASNPPGVKLNTNPFCYQINRQGFVKFAYSFNKKSSFSDLLFINNKKNHTQGVINPLLMPLPTPIIRANLPIRRKIESSPKIRVLKAQKTTNKFSDKAHSNHVPYPHQGQDAIRYKGAIDFDFLFQTIKKSLCNSLFTSLGWPIKGPSKGGFAHNITKKKLMNFQLGLYQQSSDLRKLTPNPPGVRGGFFINNKKNPTQGVTNPLSMPLFLGGKRVLPLCNKEGPLRVRPNPFRVTLKGLGALGEPSTKIRVLNVFKKTQPSKTNGGGPGVQNNNKEEILNLSRLLYFFNYLAPIKGGKTHVNSPKNGLNLKSFSKTIRYMWILENQLSNVFLINKGSNMSIFNFCVLSCIKMKSKKIWKISPNFQKSKSISKLLNSIKPCVLRRDLPEIFSRIKIRALGSHFKKPFRVTLKGLGAGKALTMGKAHSKSFALAFETTEPPLKECPPILKGKKDRAPFNKNKGFKKNPKKGALFNSNSGPENRNLISSNKILKSSLGWISLRSILSKFIKFEFKKQKYISTYSGNTPTLKGIGGGQSNSPLSGPPLTVNQIVDGGSKGGFAPLRTAFKSGPPIAWEGPLGPGEPFINNKKDKGILLRGANSLPPLLNTYKFMLQEIPYISNYVATDTSGNSLWAKPNQNIIDKAIDAPYSKKGKKNKFTILLNPGEILIKKKLLCSKKDIIKICKISGPLSTPWVKDTSLSEITWEHPQGGSGLRAEPTRHFYSESQKPSIFKELANNPKNKFSQIIFHVLNPTLTSGFAYRTEALTLKGLSGFGKDILNGVKGHRPMGEASFKAGVRGSLNSPVLWALPINEKKNLVKYKNKFQENNISLKKRLLKGAPPYSDPLTDPIALAMPWESTVLGSLFPGKAGPTNQSVNTLNPPLIAKRKSLERNKALGKGFVGRAHKTALNPSLKKGNTPNFKRVRKTDGVASIQIKFGWIYFSNEPPLESFAGIRVARQNYNLFKAENNTSNSLLAALKRFNLPTKINQKYILPGQSISDNLIFDNNICYVELLKNFNHGPMPLRNKGEPALKYSGVPGACPDGYGDDPVRTHNQLKEGINDPIIKAPIRKTFYYKYSFVETIKGLPYNKNSKIPALGTPPPLKGVFPGIQRGCVDFKESSNWKWVANNKSTTNGPPGATPQAIRGVGTRGVIKGGKDIDPKNMFDPKDQFGGIRKSHRYTPSILLDSLNPTQGPFLKESLPKNSAFLIRKVTEYKKPNLLEYKKKLYNSSHHIKEISGTLSPLNSVWALKVPPVFPGVTKRKKINKNIKLPNVRLTRKPSGNSLGKAHIHTSLGFNLTSAQISLLKKLVYKIKLKSLFKNKQKTANSKLQINISNLFFDSELFKIPSSSLKNFSYKFKKLHLLMHKKFLFNKPYNSYNLKQRANLVSNSLLAPHKQNSKVWDGGQAISPPYKGKALTMGKNAHKKKDVALSKGWVKGQNQLKTNSYQSKSLNKKIATISKFPNIDLKIVSNFKFYSSFLRGNSKGGQAISPPLEGIGRNKIDKPPYLNPPGVKATGNFIQNITAGSTLYGDECVGPPIKRGAILYRKPKIHSLFLSYQISNGLRGVFEKDLYFFNYKNLRLKFNFQKLMYTQSTYPINTNLNSFLQNYINKLTITQRVSTLPLLTGVQDSQSGGVFPEPLAPPPASLDRALPLRALGGVKYKPCLIKHKPGVYGSNPLYKPLNPRGVDNPQGKGDSGAPLGGPSGVDKIFSLIPIIFNSPYFSYNFIQKLDNRFMLDNNFLNVLSKLDVKNKTNELTDFSLTPKKIETRNQFFTSGQNQLRSLNSFLPENNGKGYTNFAKNILGVTSSYSAFQGEVISTKGLADPESSPVFHISNRASPNLNRVGNKESGYRLCPWDENTPSSDNTPKLSDSGFLQDQDSALILTKEDLMSVSLKQKNSIDQNNSENIRPVRALGAEPIENNQSDYNDLDLLLQPSIMTQKQFSNKKLMRPTYFTTKRLSKYHRENLFNELYKQSLSKTFYHLKNVIIKYKKTALRGAKTFKGGSKAGVPLEGFKKNVKVTPNPPGVKGWARFGNLETNTKYLINNVRVALPFPSHRNNLSLGEFFKYGDKLQNNLTILETGQIIHLSKDKVTLRRGQRIKISINAILHKYDTDFITPQSPVITLSYSQLKTGDIVQGIPKIEQFFEARTTKRGRLFRDSLPNLLHALFKNKIADLTNNDDAARESVHKIQQVLIEGVQRVYRDQGVTIADKHLEVIVKQMTSKARILKGGCTGYLPGDVDDLFFIETVYNRYPYELEYEPLILGISKTSLEVKSFLSAASFQHTTRVLTKAAIYRETDYLSGLKENILLGNLIPAGTGYLVSVDSKIENKKI